MPLSKGTVASAPAVGSGTTYALSFGATTTSSGVLYFAATINPTNLPPFPTVSGSVAGTFTQRGVGPAAGGNSVISYSVGFTSGQAPQTITLTMGGANTFGFLTVVAFEIGGAATSSYFDPNLASPVEGGADPLSITTTNANDLLIGVFRMNSASSPSGLEGAGWLEVAAPAGGNMLVEYRIVTSAQTALSVNLSGGGVGDSNGAIADGIIAAAAAPAPHNRMLLGVGNMIGWRATLGAAAAWKVGSELRENPTLLRRSLLIGRKR